MTAYYADKIFKDNIEEILSYGTWDENPRPKYSDGTPAHTKFITDVFEKYPAGNLAPITELRPIAWKTAIREVLWIYNNQTSNLKELHERKVFFWDEWEVGYQKEREIVKVEAKKVEDSECIPEYFNFGEIQNSIDGEIRKSEYGHGEYILIKKYTSNSNKRYRPMYDAQFIKDGYICPIRKDSIDKGQHPVNPYTKKLLGVGYMGEYKKVSGYTDVQIKNLKNKWYSMINRAYDGTRKEYSDVLVDKCWHSFQNFLETIKYIPHYSFARKNDFDNRWEIDKDYFGRNHYSPKTSVFLPRGENLKYRSTSVPIEAFMPYHLGKIKRYLTLTDFCNDFSISKKSVRRWLDNGISDDGTFAFKELFNTDDFVYRYKLIKPNIGQRYGATVRKHDIINNLLKDLEEDKFGRRHVINLWQEDDFKESEGLKPCAFLSMYTVTKDPTGEHEYMLNASLTIRSSDFLTAASINRIQYKALQLMLAKHLSMSVGTFSVFTSNMHIYDRHMENAKKIRNVALRDMQYNMAKPSPWDKEKRAKYWEQQPQLILNVPDGTDFYDIKDTDFELKNYDPIKHEPKLKFDLGI